MESVIERNINENFLFQGSKTSTSSDWLGLGDDVTDGQLNDGLTKNLDSDTQEPSSIVPVLVKTAEKNKNDELSEMLDLIPDEQKGKSDDKYVVFCIAFAK